MIKKNPVNNKVYEFKKLMSDEHKKEENIKNSPESPHITSNKRSHIKRITFCSSHNFNKINRNNSSTNITQIKGLSKFRVNKHLKSEKRLYSKYDTSKLLTLLENSQKTKSAKKVNICETNKKKENNDILPKKIRHDNYGNIINKENKKFVHIVFADQLKEKSITEEIQIESFKKFNYIIEETSDDIFNPTNPLRKCCNIF